MGRSIIPSLALVPAPASPQVIQVPSPSQISGLEVRLGNISDLIVSWTWGDQTGILYPLEVDVLRARPTSGTEILVQVVNGGSGSSPSIGTLPRNLIAEVMFEPDHFPGIYPVQTSAASLVSPSGGLQSVADPQYYVPIINHQRQQLVNVADYEYSEAQIGRLLYRDGFENPLQWAVVSGAGALDTSTYLKGTTSLKMTAAAGAAGNQAIMRKGFQVAADQFNSTFPLLVAEFWFKSLDANIRDIQLWIRPDNSLTRFQAAARYFFQQAGVFQGELQYVDSSGVFQNITNYPVRLGAGTVQDTWHHVMLGVNYLQGSSSSTGYLTYAVVKFDDFTFKPCPWNTPPGACTINAQRLASNGFLETTVDLIVTTDNANASVINADEFFLADLSNAFQL